MIRFFRAGHDDVVIVRTERGFQQSKGFADPSLEAIALHRVAARLYRDPEPEMLEFVGDAENHALAKAKHFATVEETAVLPGVMETKLRRESRRRRR